jgi:hypothetical protein
MAELLLVLFCVVQEVQQDELCLTNMRVLGPSSPAPGGMQLFKLPAPDAGEGRATGRTQRGTAAAPPPAATLPIVRSVDVTLAAHIEGLAPQVGKQLLGRLLLYCVAAWQSWLQLLQFCLVLRRAASLHAMTCQNLDIVPADQNVCRASRCA